MPVKHTHFSISLKGEFAFKTAEDDDMMRTNDTRRALLAAFPNASGYVVSEYSRHERLTREVLNDPEIYYVFERCDGHEFSKWVKVAGPLTHTSAKAHAVAVRKDCLPRWKFAVARCAEELDGTGEN